MPTREGGEADRRHSARWAARNISERSPHRQLEVVHAVEGAGGEDAGGGGGGEALSRGKVRLVVVQHQPRHVAAHQDLVRHAGHVREVVAGRRGGKESLRIHRELCGPADVATLVDRGDNQLGRVPARPRVQALVGARHEAHAGQQRRVEAPVRAGPVGMLAHEADAAGDKELYRALRGHVLLEIFNRAEGHCDRSRAKAKGNGKGNSRRRNVLNGVIGRARLLGQPN